MQKGLVPSRLGGAADICEEGLGFGVPIAQYRRDFFFPGSSEVSHEGVVPEGSSWKEFDLNLIERRQGQADNEVRMFSWVYPRTFNRFYKSALGQKLMTVLKPNSTLAETESPNKEHTFLQVASKGKVITKYSRVSGRIDLLTDVSNLSTTGLQHVYISNEVGGTAFDHFYDSSGTKLVGDRIGGWTRIRAERAAFVAPALDLAVIVEIPDEVECYAGREIIAPDIHWSGVIFQVDSVEEEFAYSLRVTTARGGKVMSS